MEIQLLVSFLVRLAVATVSDRERGRGTHNQLIGQRQKAEWFARILMQRSHDAVYTDTVPAERYGNNVWLLKLN